MIEGASNWWGFTGEFALRAFSTLLFKWGLACNALLYLVLLWREDTDRKSAGDTMRLEFKKFLGLGVWPLFISLVVFWLSFSFEASTEYEAVKVGKLKAEGASAKLQSKVDELIAENSALKTRSPDIRVIREPAPKPDIEQRIDGGSGNMNVAGNVNIDAKPKPRVLSDIQKQRIIGALRKVAIPQKVDLGSPPTQTLEESNLATQILEVLNSASWKVDDARGRSIRTGPTPTVGVVVSVSVKDTEKFNNGYRMRADAPAAVLQSALAAEGIDATLEININQGEGLVSIHIGPQA